MEPISFNQIQTIGSKNAALVPLSQTKGFKWISAGGEKSQSITGNTIFVQPIKHEQSILSSIDFNLCVGDFDQTTIAMSLHTPKPGIKLRSDEYIVDFNTVLKESIKIAATPGWNRIDLSDFSIKFPKNGFNLYSMLKSMTIIRI
ncbi:MAG: hypothetical protein OXE77_00575 [Flavobacteriaceae bacterium]|nr:hypothetical protein [Flavobacteriaceae bacterium]